MTVSITKPTIGGSENTWGTTNNQALDDIVAVLNGTTASTPNLTAGSFKVSGTAVTSVAADLNILSGAAAAGVTATEFGHLNGVTSAIQTQLDAISVPPTASIVMYGGTSAPTGWLLCNGAAVSRTTYADLFAIVGTTYGAGNGSSTFNLPDLRDRFAVGSGTTYSNGSTGGAATHTLSEAEMPSHTHTATSTVTDPGHDHTMNGQSYGDGGDGVMVTGSVDASAPDVVNDATTGITVATTNASTGSGSAHNNLPPYLGLAFIIKI